MRTRWRGEFGITFQLNAAYARVAGEVQMTRPNAVVTPTDPPGRYPWYQRFWWWLTRRKFKVYLNGVELRTHQAPKVSFREPDVAAELDGYTSGNSDVTVQFSERLSQ